MSIDRSLKTGSGLSRHRNVLTRTERIARLADQGTFDMDKDSPIGLPKVANRKIVTAKSSKKKDEAAAEPAKK